jgi:transglutaminase-like putative cysteine protease
MSIHVALHHRTSYAYDRPVALGPQVVRLRPAPHSRTRVLSYALKVEPKDHFINWQQDPQGNHLARLVFPEKTEVRSDRRPVADMTVINPFDFFLEPDGRALAVRLRSLARRGDRAVPQARAAVAAAHAWLASVDRKQQRTVDFLVGLNARLQKEIGYIVRLEPGVQSCEETLQLAKGSCRDTGWLLVTILRHLGFAARFASGYLIQLIAGREAAGWPRGPDARLHRPACVGRGLSAGRRLDRPRSDLGPVHRRGPHPARLHARAVERGADRGRGRRERGAVLL